jgi:hypothetical protein
MRRFLAALVVLCSSLGVQADSWPAPRALGKPSATGSYVVRVAPGTSKGDVVGYSGAPKGPYAVAEWHRYDGTGYTSAHRATLLNPIAPEDIEVTERGNLITLDNWHNRGMGVVLAIYTPEGRVLKRYTLLDLYSERDVKRIRTSVSSVHWRCERLSTVLDSPRELWIDDSLGGRFVVNVETGSFTYEANGGSCGR